MFDYRCATAASISVTSRSSSSTRAFSAVVLGDALLPLERIVLRLQFLHGLNRQQRELGVVDGLEAVFTGHHESGNTASTSCAIKP